MPGGYSAQCSGKEAFATPALARRIMSRMRRPEAMVYRCSFCGLWHIGATPRKRMTKVAKKDSHKFRRADLEP